MKFRSERDSLVNALTTSARAAGNKGGFQLSLTGIHLALTGDELALTATDRELSIRVLLAVNGQSDGKALPPARLASDVTRSLDIGAVDIELSEEILKVDSAQCHFSLSTMNVDDFPVVKLLEGDPVVVKAEILLAAMRQVVHAASTDESRPVLTGVLLEADENGLRLVTTDSYRLALCDLAGVEVLESGNSMIIPARALQEVIRLLDDAEEVNLWFSDQEAAFGIDNVTIITRLIEGDFPNYQGLIPDHQPNSLSVNKEALIGAIRRVKLMALDSTPIRLDMTADRLELSAVQEGIGQVVETLNATYEGEDLVVAFNPEYLINGVQATPGEEIVLNTVDALKPAVMRASGVNDYLYLLMPVRVS
ncbi:MAG: DNA polymerase III subunit beta [bacterium]|nr:DNA polymerase III subunit beta [bacterium]MCY4258193.1 DNA polymerase III subunit beta [bacterium]